MLKLIQFLKDQQTRKKLTAAETFNLCREYLQVLILKAIYQSKHGKCLSFMGGTCLRICYHLPRLSEDLDFTLDRKTADYSFSALNKDILLFLKNENLEAENTINENKNVQTSFIKFKNLLKEIGLSNLKDHKLHIKVEIDSNPVKVKSDKIETFFVNKFEEFFPILIHSQDVLFAGKIAAILTRPFYKGRDFYDLIWYLSRKTLIDLDYLNKRLKQSNTGLKYEKLESLFEKLTEKVNNLPIRGFLADIEKLIEDQTNLKWLADYRGVFERTSKEYLNTKQI